MPDSGWNDVLERSNLYRDLYSKVHFSWAPNREPTKCKKIFAKRFIREEVRYALEAGYRDEGEILMRLERSLEGFLVIDHKSEPLIKEMVRVMLDWWNKQC